nr:hypothetical protein GTC16762_26460 [Pigmentibacter ruber]
MISVTEIFIEKSFSLSYIGVRNLAWKRKDILNFIKDDCLIENIY